MLDGTTENLLVEFDANLITTKEIFEKLNVPTEKQEEVKIALNSFKRAWDEDGTDDQKLDKTLDFFANRIANILA